MTVPKSSQWTRTNDFENFEPTGVASSSRAPSGSNQDIDYPLSYEGPSYSYPTRLHETHDLVHRPKKTPEPYISWLVNNGAPGILLTSLPICAIFIGITGVLCLFVMNLIRILCKENIAWRNSESLHVWLVLVSTASTVVWSPVTIFYIGSLLGGWKLTTWRSTPFVLASALLAVGYCMLVANKDESYMVHASIRDGAERSIGARLQVWATGMMPRLPQECAARVAPQQAPLFTRDVYDSQFARAIHLITNITETWTEATPFNQRHQQQMVAAFDWERFRSVQDDHTLCNQGFVGNTDLYGLGIRSGVYMQWLSSMLANNFLSTRRQEIQRIYLVFSLAICLATIIASFSKACVFGMEIIILYWMFWGGYICVFGSAPCPIRLGSVSSWMRLDWMTVIVYLTLWSMSYHAFWFFWYAYDQSFARMPCGTVHWFIVPVLDPSKEFWLLRDLSEVLALPVFFIVLVAFPWFTLLIIPEFKHAIQMSAVYKIFVRKVIARGQEQNRPAEHAIARGKLPLHRRMYRKIARLHRELRLACSLPGSSRGGICLVTPADVQQRRQVPCYTSHSATDYDRLLRIRWAITGSLSFIASVFAIECILKWNQVRGIYAIDSTGQYIPLIISVASLISVIWSVAKQEIVRHHFKYFHHLLTLNRSENVVSWATE
jgi:hypothetical protein